MITESTPSTDEVKVTEMRVAVAVTVNRVNRSLTPQQVLDATNRRQYTNSAVVATMPSNGTGVQENVTVEFFPIRKNVSSDEAAKAYEEHGLTPDLYAQAAVNEADPAFADKYPNGTQWQDADGNWCYAAFRRSDGERYVFVHRNDYDWLDCWWLGGVRKPARRNDSVGG